MLFLQACLLGVLLGVFYDILRCLRESLPTGKWFLFAEDLLFCAGFLLATLLFLTGASHGRLRAWCIAGELGGLWLYFQTAGRLLLAAVRRLRRLRRRLTRRICGRLALLRQKWAAVFAKVSKNIDFSGLRHLKKPGGIVYNKTNPGGKDGVLWWRRKPGTGKRSKGSSLR